MQATLRRVEWILWLQWILANALGWAVGAAIISLNFKIAAFGVVIVIPTVVLQWLVLQQRIHHLRWWLLASITSLSLLFSWTYDENIGRIKDLAAWVVLGAVIVAQWLTARNRLHQPSLVILGCKLISLWSLSGVSLLAAFVAAILLVQEGLAAVLGQVITGAIAGTIGGAILGLPLLIMTRGLEEEK